MPELLRVRGGSPPDNIITDRIVSINEIVERFGSNPDDYLKHRSPKLLTFGSEYGPESRHPDQRHVAIIIKEEEIEPEIFPEAGCYVVKNRS